MPLTPEEQQQFETLQAEYDRLSDAWQESGEDDEPEQLTKLAEQIEAIEERWWNGEDDPEP